MGSPTCIEGVNIDGVVTKYTHAGETAEIFTRYWIDSDHPLFHRLASGLHETIYGLSKEKQIDIKNYKTVLVVIKPDSTAQLWLDTAAIAFQAITRRSVSAGLIVMEQDIADIISMSFPLVEIEAEDKVIILFRQDWRFGLYFDFNPEKSLNKNLMEASLGQLYRRMKYHHIYDLIRDEELFSQLKKEGWFPFIELIGQEFQTLTDLHFNGQSKASYENLLVQSFNDARLTSLVDRWKSKPYLQGKTPILESIKRSFIAEDPVAVIKVVLTEIEGILLQAYKAKTGETAKTWKLLDFAISSAEDKTGSADTLFLTAEFAKHLKEHVYAVFDPSSNDGQATSRHAVGHGVATAESYTMTRALQAILTLDQLAFYI